MSAAVADIVGANLSGQRRAKELLGRIRAGVSHPDELDVALSRIADPHERRGLLRAVQKELELASDEAGSS